MRMHHSPYAVVLTLCLSLAGAAAFAGNVPATPPAPAAPPAPPVTSTAVPSPPEIDESAAGARIEEARQREDAARQREDVLRAQMEAARRRLEVAAQQLAALSAQMYGPMMRRLATVTGPPRVLMGVQLDDSSGHAGARVREVSPGGPAEQAGVRVGDLIVAVNGKNVRGQEPAMRVVELLHGVKPGDKVDLQISRDGKTRDVAVTARPDGDDFFIAMPKMPPMPPMPPMKALAGWGRAPMMIGGPVADMELARLTPGLGRYFGTDTGVLVVRAPRGGALGLQDGDVILSIGGREPIDSSHVIRILGSYDPGEKITMEVQRLHHRISVAARIPDEPSVAGTGIVIRKGGMLGPQWPH
jgi:membrane-associated protease RseP (regulator of RpoE activity)